MMKICDHDCNLGYIERLFLPHRTNGTDTLLAKREAALVSAQFGWLSRSPEAFRTEVIERAAVRKAEPNEIVYLAGDPSNGLFGLVSGTIKIELVTEDSECQVAFVGRPGFWFGEIAAFRKSNRVITDGRKQVTDGRKQVRSASIGQRELRGHGEGLSVDASFCISRGGESGIGVAADGHFADAQSQEAPGV